MAFYTPKVAVALLLIRLMGRVIEGNGSCTSLRVYDDSGSAILLFVQCRPVAALWDPAVEATANCWDPNVLAD